MELIFYSEAANLLGVKLDTLKHAVSRGELTKAGHDGRNVCLIKEQVMLFKGRRLSKSSLNTAKMLEWQRYAEASQGHNIPVPGIEERIQRAAQEGMERGIKQGAMYVAAMLQSDLQELQKKVAPLLEQAGRVQPNF